jgi:proteic killer suppression protein
LSYVGALQLGSAGQGRNFSRKFAAADELSRSALLDMRYITRYAETVILSIRHKGLKWLYEDDDARGVTREHLEKLRDILGRLDAAASPADMDLPGFRLHPLKGELRGFWAVTVRANWRVIFRFAGPNAVDVDYLDYH